MMRWAGSVVVVAIFGVLALGSEVSKTDGSAKASSASASASAAPLAEVNPRLRDDVIAAVKPFDRGDLAPKDPALYDPCIRDAVARTETGSEKYPQRVENAAWCVMRKLADDAEGKAALEKTLEARYTAPVITRAGGTVRIDLGQVAGKITNYNGLGVDTERWDSAGLVPSEVVRNLKTGMEKEPGADRYQVEVENPKTSGRTRKTLRYTYVYRPATKVIEVYDGNDVCTTAELADLSELKSLSRFDIKCTELPFRAGGRYDPRTTLDR